MLCQPASHLWELNAACFCLSAGSPVEKLHVGFVWEWQRLGSGTCMCRCFYCEKNTGVGWSLNSRQPKPISQFDLSRASDITCHFHPVQVQSNGDSVNRSQTFF